MQATEQTIDHGTLRRLVDAGGRIGARIVGQAGAWGIIISHGRSRRTLAAARGEARTFRKFETLANYLKEFHIAECTVILADFDPGDKGTGGEKRRAMASDRLKVAHAAAAHDRWIQDKVQTSLADPRPNISHAKVMHTARALINKKRKQHAGKAEA
jgi:hypothetical protein